VKTLDNRFGYSYLGDAIDLWHLTARFERLPRTWQGEDPEDAKGCGRESLREFHVGKNSRKKVSTSIPFSHRQNEAMVALLMCGLLWETVI
jgi:hypothetical protein